MLDQTKISLDKKEVARRQLAAAMELWFADGEPVAIHTLACAAHEVLAALLKKQGKPALMFDPERYRPGCAGIVKKALHRHYNFFKHANSDPDAEIEFPVGIAEVFLLISVEGWRTLVGSREPIHFAFWFWCLIHHSELMPLNDRQTGVPLEPIPNEKKRLFIGMPKRQFLTMATSAFNGDEPSEVLSMLNAHL